MPLPSLFLAAVIGVTDGATLTVRYNRQAITVHLAEIEAPGLERAFGVKSRQHLRKLCRGGKAEIRPQFKDRSGGFVADVSCAGKDAGTEQVRAGLALVDERHSTKRVLYEAQANARKLRRGVWTDPKTVSNWENPGSKKSAPNPKKVEGAQASPGSGKG